MQMLTMDMTQPDPTDRNDADQLRDTVAQLTHLVAEALTAIDAYLHASQRLGDLSDPSSQAKLQDAISKAIEQSTRAREALTQLRSVVQN